MIQFTHIDNRAELKPAIYDQTPWLTRFDVVSASAGANSPTTVAAEYAWGDTTVAFPIGPSIGTFTMDFATTYVLISHKRGNDRWTGRIERFTTNGSHFDPADFTRERGHAVTAAWLHDSGPHVRYGLEYVHVTARHPAFGVDPGGSTITAEIRYGF
jgi:hypothetical protein